MYDADFHIACTGNDTFVRGFDTNTWPDDLSGFLCKTDVINPIHSRRFADCCSGTVINVTDTTQPGDPGYPLICSIVCQVDPALAAEDEDLPDHQSRYGVCLIAGNDPDEYAGFEDMEIECTSKGRGPTSFATTPTGIWATKTFSEGAFTTGDAPPGGLREPAGDRDDDDDAPGSTITSAPDGSSAEETSSDDSSAPSSTPSLGSRSGVKGYLILAAVAAASFSVL